MLTHCDAVAPTVPSAPKLTPKPAKNTMGERMILSATIFASSLAFIDGSVVNVGLSAIGLAFHADGSTLTWVINGYLLPLGALLLVGGAAGDLFGKRRLLIFGLVLFALASTLCALALSFNLLVLGRIAQGIGAAFLMPNSLSILADTFSGAKRGRAVGIWAGVGAAAGALAPVLGGWLIDHFGWRMIFLVNLPIAACALLLAVRSIPPSVTSPHRHIDVTGAILVSLCLTALTWSMTEASSSTGSLKIVALAIVLGAVALIAFISTEAKQRGEAMLPLALFRSREVAGLTLLTFLLYGALGGVVVLIPFLLIKVHHYSATEAGAALLPLPLIIAFASPSMGRMAIKVGARTLLTVGPAVVAVGLLLCLRMSHEGNYWSAACPAIIVIALGLSCAVAPLTTAVLGSVTAEQTGIASGLNSAVARIGGLVATAALGGVLAAQGAALATLFDVSVACGAAIAFSAGIVAFLTVAGPASAARG